MKLPDRRSFLHLAAGAAALPAASRIARAQAYPTRQVRDHRRVSGRRWARSRCAPYGSMAIGRLGQPFNVENRPGAGRQHRHGSGRACARRRLYAAFGDRCECAQYGALRTSNMISSATPRRWLASPRAHCHGGRPIIAGSKPSPNSWPMPRPIRARSRWRRRAAGSPVCHGGLVQDNDGPATPLVHVPYRGGALTDLLAGRCKVTSLGAWRGRSRTSGRQAARARRDDVDPL